MKKIFLVLALIASTSFAFSQEKPLVHVNGEHTIMVTPDEAEVNFTVLTNHKNLQEAKKINDAIMSKVIAYLRSQKIAEKDIRTTRVSLNPYNEYEKDKPVPMFRASQSVSFQVTDLDKLAVLLSGLVEQGVNNIQNVEFKSSRIAQLQNEARSKAVADARQKAGILAEAAGLTLGAAYTIHDNTSSNNPRPMAMYKMEASMADSESAIANGEIEVTSRVNISFLLGN